MIGGDEKIGGNILQRNCIEQSGITLDKLQIKLLSGMSVKVEIAVVNYMI